MKTACLLTVLLTPIPSDGVAEKKPVVDVKVANGNCVVHVDKVKIVHLRYDTDHYIALKPEAAQYSVKEHSKIAKMAKKKIQIPNNCAVIKFAFSHPQRFIQDDKGKIVAVEKCTHEHFMFIDVQNKSLVLHVPMPHKRKKLNLCIEL